jgi:hypothetical protein
MKQSARLLLCVAIAVWATACQPDTQTLAKRIQGQLQQRINSTFRRAAGAIRVRGLTVTKEAAHEYRGVAEVSAFGGRVPLRLSIVAHRHAALYRASPAEWARFERAVHEREMAPLTGEAKPVSSDIAVRSDAILSCFPRALGTDRKKLADRLESAAPVTRDGPYFFGSGCQAHDCAGGQAAWAIDEATGTGVAIIETADSTGGAEFFVYGGRIAHLPAPLAAWGAKNGMTALNSVAIP